MTATIGSPFWCICCPSKIGIVGLQGVESIQLMLNSIKTISFICQIKSGVLHFQDFCPLECLSRRTDFIGIEQLSVLQVCLSKAPVSKLLTKSLRIINFKNFIN